MSQSGRARAQIRALVLMAVVLDVPVLARVVRLLSPNPIVEMGEVDGVPVEILHPPDKRPRPAWIFVSGADPIRRQEPLVRRLATGLARAGFVVVVPDIPGLGDGTITSRTLSATEAVTRAACERDDVRGGRVALIGASTGAGLALLAAGHPELADRVSVVAAVAPFADLRKLLCLTTTGRYAEQDGFVMHDVTDLHRRVVARSLVAALEDDDDRDRLLADLSRIESHDLNPLDELPKHAGSVGADAQAVLALLGNRDPERYDELYEALPNAVKSFIADLSPLRVREGLGAQVEMIVPPSDVYFPIGEALALADSLPNVRLTVTPTMDHTRPTASLNRVKDFAAFAGFVVRGLKAAG